MKILINLNEIFLIYINLVFYFENKQNVNIINWGLILLSIIHLANLDLLNNPQNKFFIIVKSIVQSLLAVAIFLVLNEPIQFLFTFIVSSIVYVFLGWMSSILRKNIFEKEPSTKKSWLEESKLWKYCSTRFKWNYRDLRKRTLRSSSIVITIAWTLSSVMQLYGSNHGSLVVLILFFSLLVLSFLQISIVKDWQQKLLLLKLSTNQALHLVSLQNQWMVLRGSCMGLILSILSGNSIEVSIILTICLSIFLYLVLMGFLFFLFKNYRRMIV